MKIKKLKFLVMPMLLAILLSLVVLAFQNYYRRQLWDPETVALVNGRPIYRQTLGELITAGLRPSVVPSAGNTQQSIRNKLDRLIDEELIRQAAQKAGVVITQEDINQNIQQYRDSMGCNETPIKATCQPPRGESMKSYSEAIGQRLLLQNMVRIVAAKTGSYDSRLWRQFWRKFLLDHALVSVYRVRVLLAQDTPQVEEKLQSAKNNATLGQLANQIKEAGYTVMITDTMMLNLLDPQSYTMFNELNLRGLFQEALNQPSRLTKPVKFQGSVAVFEVIGSIGPADPIKLATAAKTAFEREVAEKAFEIWLANLRSEAKIEINPGLFDIGLDTTTN
ncbi:MAG: SurA N-terminal domain-containing protein [Deltaproteobacteria bacterium]|nr:SurA N-terminal domain-containing protein [Deltaproteobacteria bacterium]